MTDPLTDVVNLLQPGALLSKIATGCGAWRVRREATGEPFYCALLEGAARLEVEGSPALDLERGDFVLVPSVFGFVMSGHGQEPPGTNAETVTMLASEVRHGDPTAPANARMLIGHFSFGSPDAALLVSLLPTVLTVRGEARLSTLLHLLADEARAGRPARDVVVAKLLEVMLIEALRFSAGTNAAPGLVRGLSDERLAAAIRKVHEAPGQAWTIAMLAREAALSRSAFFERFQRAVGLAPMEYVLSWRMALAKHLLRRGEGNVSEIAEKVGYRSASTFSTAFTRFVGIPPRQYGRAAPAALPA